MAEKTFVNYDELEKIGKTFDKESEAVAALENQLRQKAQQLETEWIGEGADKFFNEFFQEILPAVNRVKQACVMTSQTIRVVSKIFDEAEEETAGYFKDGSLEESGAGVGAGGGGATVDSSGINPSGMGPGLNSAPGGPVGTQPVQERVVVGEAPGTGGGSGIDVSEIDFGVEDMPGTGGGEEAGFKVETGMKPVPANEEQFDYKEQTSEPASAESQMGGGGGGGSSAGSQGIGGGLEMGVGGHSQTSSGPGAAATGAGGGSAGMQDRPYQTTSSGASQSPGASPQSVPGAATTGEGPRPVQQGGLRDAAGAAGALGGAGAAAGGGAAAAKKLKENKEGE